MKCIEWNNRCNPPETYNKFLISLMILIPHILKKQYMIGYCFKETKYSRNVKRVNFLLLKLVRYFLYLFTDHNITNPQVILSSSNYVECISVYASCNFIDSLGSIKWKHVQSVFYGGDFILFCNVEWCKVWIH